MKEDTEGEERHGAIVNMDTGGDSFSRKAVVHQVPGDTFTPN